MENWKMSSTEFVTIYDHAAAVVRSELGSTSEVNRVLADFRRRALSNERDPLRNRDLIVEPLHESQVLEVPGDLVEKVAATLHRLNILHIWVRASCPASDEGEDTVIETDNPATFRDALASPCPHCAQLHEDIDWNCLETFYAFHFDNAPDKFKFSNYFKKRQTLPIAVPPAQSRYAAFRTWLQEGPLSVFFRQKVSSPAEAVIVALESNAPTTRIPSQKETLVTLWTRGVILLLVGLAITFLVNLASTTWAIICGTVFLFAFVTLAWVTWRTIWASANLERLVLTCGCVMSAALLGSATGLSFDGTIDNLPSQRDRIEKKQIGPLRWHVQWKFGETNGQLVQASVLTFVGTLIAVFALNWNRISRE